MNELEVFLKRFNSSIKITFPVFFFVPTVMRTGLLGKCTLQKPLFTLNQNVNNISSADNHYSKLLKVIWSIALISFRDFVF